MRILFQDELLRNPQTLRKSLLRSRINRRPGSCPLELFHLTDRVAAFPTHEIEILAPVAWYERHRSKTLISQGVYVRIKRLLDLLLCCMALPLVGPLLAICALAIVIDSPGPVYFFQWRTGGAEDASGCSSFARWFGTPRS